MDDNRIQATSAYRSGYKYKSGCEHKRDSSFLGNSPSERHLISDMAAGIRLFPGAAALKKSRGGEKKESSRHHGHIDPSIASILLLTVSPKLHWEVFLALFPQHRPTFFKEFTKFCFEEAHIR